DQHEVSRDTVSGAVEAPDGSRAAFALVALNRLSGERIAATTTDEHGDFQLPRPKEPYALTVTSTRGMALFVPPVAPAHAPAAPLRVNLEDASRGLKLTGTLKRSGGTPPSTLVAASRISDDQGDIFYADVAPDGAFSLIVPPGMYVLWAGSKK